MHQIFDCKLDDATFDSVVDRFVPQHDVYFFDGEEILNELLRVGITVYTREEFGDRFPLFALHYGVVYHLWMMKRPKESYAISVSPARLAELSPHVLQQLLEKQVEYGRGHIYTMDWLHQLGIPEKKTVCTRDKDFYFLTWDDWRELNADVRKQWILKWLTQHRKEDVQGLCPEALVRNDSRVAYDLVDQYAGRFSRHSTANCFAAAIALAVGDGPASHELISEWLFQGPFFRLLQGQGYTKITEYRKLCDVVFEPTDVLVWYTGNVAGHAAYAVTDDVIFQKQGQGWTEPWQLLKFTDVWYNEYLQADGYIEVYRKL